MESSQNTLPPRKERSSLMTIIPSNAICPRCFSKVLYRFGKDKEGFQKYQCKRCKRQFAPDNPLSNSRARHQRKYPACPICGKATFLHHDHTYYSNFRCCDKKCNHSFHVPKLIDVQPPSSELEPQSFSFKGMRHSLHTVLCALNYYFCGNSTTRKISHILHMVHQINVSHVTISKWIKRFAPVFKKIATDKLLGINICDSDEWHFDETYIKISGKDHYLWLAIDSETRLVLDFHLSPNRDSSAAHSLLSNCRKKFGQPRSAIISDRYYAYQQPASLFFPQARHVRVEDFDDVVNNNVIEAFNGQFKAWYKPKRGFNSYESANRLIATYIFFYNFIRPHSSLNGLTPAQVAGAKCSEREQLFWFLVA
jgi:transposase-like protein/DNA-directed RNA polymerase subunit RPC12/RpoP